MEMSTFGGLKQLSAERPRAPRSEPLLKLLSRNHSWLRMARRFNTRSPTPTCHFTKRALRSIRKARTKKGFKAANLTGAGFGHGLRDQTDRWNAVPESHYTSLGTCPFLL